MNEKRQYPRISEHADAIVTIKSVPGKPELTNLQYECKTTDISLRGVQLLIDNYIEVGTLLELAVEFNHLREIFMHIGNVVWIHESPDQDGSHDKWYNMGIRFDVSSNTQYKSWVFAITEMLGDAELV